MGNSNTKWDLLHPLLTPLETRCTLTSMWYATSNTCTCVYMWWLPGMLKPYRSVGYSSAQVEAHESEQRKVESVCKFACMLPRIHVFMQLVSCLPSLLPATQIVCSSNCM